jgi:hypothetical protein
MGDALHAVILTCAIKRWQKVPRMIAQVADRAGAGISFDAIAARIRILVENGKLESKGDPSRWRHSEIRLPRSQ